MIRLQPPLAGPGLIGGPGCGSCGCLILLSLLIIVIALLAVGYFWGLTPVGPSVEAGRYSVRTADGRIRTEQIGTQPARRFDLKVRDTEAIPLQSNIGIDIILSEAEINSKLLELLEERRREDPNLNITSALIVLHPGEATAFVNGDLLSRDAGVEVGVEFGIDEQKQLDIDVKRVRTGKLPPIPLGSAIANALIERSGLEERLEAEFPTRLSAVRIEEGRLIVAVTPQGIAEDAPTPNAEHSRNETREALE